MISPPPPAGTLVDFLLLSAASILFPPLAPLYSCDLTSAPWPFINTLSLRSMSSKTDGKKSINFLCCDAKAKNKKKREKKKLILIIRSKHFSVGAEHWAKASFIYRMGAFTDNWLILLGIVIRHISNLLLNGILELMVRFKQKRRKCMIFVQ